MEERRGFPPVTQEEFPIHTADDLAFDSDSRQVWHGRKLLRLTKIEYDLLLALVESRGQICTAEELMKRVWEQAWLGDPHVVETHIGRLRAKLGESGRHPGHIHTVRGVGYRFQAHPQEPDEPVEPLATLGEWVVSVLLRVTVSASGEVLDVTADIIEDETDGRDLTEFA